MHVVFVGAHPDDETFAGGTLAIHAARGDRVTIVVASRGSMGHWETPPEELARIRTGEMEAAAGVIGAQVLWLDHQDASIPGGDELREALVEVYRVLKPDAVITFHPLVWRDDHRRVGLAASDATLKASLPLHVTGYPAHRPEPEVYFFGEPMAPVQPDTYVDVTPVMEAKREAFGKHRSQWASWPTDGPDDPDRAEKMWVSFRRRFATHGAACGVPYAEAFISRAGKKTALRALPSR